MVEYRLELDDKYLDDIYARHRRYKKLDVWFSPLRAILAIACAVAIWVFLQRDDRVLVMLLGATLVVLLIGPQVVYSLSARRFRKSPFFGEDVTFRVDEDGYARTDSRSFGELSWGTVRAARRFSDGFLILVEPQGCHWWPDSALVGGTVEEAAQLLRDHVEDFEE